MRSGVEHLRQALRVKQGIEACIDLRRRPDRHPCPSTLRNGTETPMQRTKQRLGLALAEV